MAESIIPQTEPLRFTVTPGIYQLAPEVSKGAVISQLNVRLDQLSAMLVMTVGNGSETFSNWSDEIRENYLWAASMLANECRDLVVCLSNRQ